jgi:hypothetical protein
MDLQEVSMAGLKNKKARVDLSRPSIDLDRTSSPREWRDVSVLKLDRGDIVAGMGLIIDLQPTCRAEILIVAGVPERKEYWVADDAIVKAFVKKEG